MQLCVMFGQSHIHLTGYLKKNNYIGYLGEHVQVNYFFYLLVIKFLSTFSNHMQVYIKVMQTCLCGLRLIYMRFGTTSPAAMS